MTLKVLIFSTTCHGTHIMIIVHCVFYVPLGGFVRSLGDQLCNCKAYRRESLHNANFLNFLVYACIIMLRVVTILNKGPLHNTMQEHWTQG